jgi:hypothetical protein
LFGHGFIDLERALSSLETNVLIVDSTEPLVEIHFNPDEIINLKPKAEIGPKTWVLVETSIYPGLTFARPSDSVAHQQGQYLSIFQNQGILVPEANSLFFSGASAVAKIDFGILDFSGLGKVTITTKKGINAEDLETIQRIDLIPN